MTTQTVGRSHAIFTIREIFRTVKLAEGWTYDSTAMLSLIAARTQRIRLLPGVLSVWSRTPGVLAMGAATLHEITGGRAILGLGTSTQTLTEAYTVSLTRVPPTNSAGSRHRFVSCSTANERRQRHRCPPAAPRIDPDT